MELHVLLLRGDSDWIMITYYCYSLQLLENCLSKYKFMKL